MSFFSSWRFVHKDKTVFGDELWLSVFGLNNNKDGSNSEQFDIVESPTVSLISITTAGASADEDTLNSSTCHCDMISYELNSIILCMQQQASVNLLSITLSNVL